MNQRQNRKNIAQNTLEIIKNGYFINAKGEKIQIGDLQKKAESLTKVYTPEESDALLANMNSADIVGKTAITVTNQSTLEAVRELFLKGHKDVLCLNFASAKNPGGGFLGGSQAQEESIARSTGLYNCQMQTNGYYETNRTIGSCMYTDFMIYSPFVPIVKDDEGNLVDSEMYTAIITAPAVNTGVVKKREPEKVAEIESVMKRRIKKVLAISLANNHKTIVLGAWGCGVFQNNPNDIARFFKEVIGNDFENKFEKIVFAIYSNKPKFIEPFKSEFVKF